MTSSRRLEVSLLSLLNDGRKQLPQKILLTSRRVKGKIAFRNGVGFQAQIEDLPVKRCILRNDLKNKGTGGSFCFPLKIRGMGDAHCFLKRDFSWAKQNTVLSRKIEPFLLGCYTIPAAEPGPTPFNSGLWSAKSLTE